MVSSKKMKRLAVPVAAGIFVITVAIFSFIYIQQKSEQNSLKEQIGWLDNMLSQPVYVNEDSQARFEEIQQYVPVIAAVPQDGEYTELQFIEEVNARVIDAVSDPLLYPTIDAGTTGNFSIKYTMSKAQKINNVDYKIFTFNIKIDNIEYDELRDFVLDISTTETLRTLVVSQIMITRYATDVSVDLDFDIYGRVT